MCLAWVSKVCHCGVSHDCRYQLLAVSHAVYMSSLGPKQQLAEANSRVKTVMCGKGWVADAEGTATQELGV